MTEQQLVQKLQQLRQIKPRENWVVFAKSKIFEEQKKASILEFLPALFQRKFSYAFATALLILAGVFGFVQSTLPGDTLFPVKKIAEQSQAAITGRTALKTSVENYNKRAQDLAQAVKESKQSNIPSAKSEVKAALMEIVAEVRGMNMESEEEASELNNVLEPIVKSEIESMEETELTEDQQKTLIEIKELYEEGSYSEALEKILLF